MGKHSASTLLVTTSPSLSTCGRSEPSKGPLCVLSSARTRCTGRMLLLSCVPAAYVPGEPEEALGKYPLNNRGSSLAWNGGLGSTPGGLAALTSQRYAAQVLHSDRRTLSPTLKREAHGGHTPWAVSPAHDPRAGSHSPGQQKY